MGPASSWTWSLTTPAGPCKGWLFGMAAQNLVPARRTVLDHDVVFAPWPGRVDNY